MSDKNFFVADTHCDTLGFADVGKSGLINEYNNSKKYQHLQVYAMYCAEEGETDTESFERACRYSQIYRNAALEEIFVACKSYTEIRNALDRKSKNIALLSIEGCECLNGSFENLYRFYEDGVRMLAPVWNHNNIYASGSISTGTADDTGLTDKGFDLVKLCEKLGIVVDVSHSSDNTIEDILSISDRPVCASHSNFRSVCNHSRNLKTEHALEISKNGGYIGLNLYHKFVRSCDTPEVTSYHISDLINHIKYAEKIDIIKNIGFGFDIDGTGGLYPDEVDLNVSIHDMFIEKYLRTECDAECVKNISGENLMRFLCVYGL